jgi:hypothetical protein
VKSIIVIPLLFIFLLESLFPKGLALVESSKMAKLVEHFQEHVLESGNEIGFAEFLWMHYNPNSDHENEEHHHEKLPNFSMTNSFVGFIYQSITELFGPIDISYAMLVSTLPEYRNGYHFLFSLDLLNPPQ